MKFLYLTNVAVIGKAGEETSVFQSGGSASPAAETAQQPADRTCVATATAVAGITGYGRK